MKLDMFENQQPTALLNPPLKWAGGKRWLLPYLVNLWHGFETSRLVEPFCGGIAVSLGLRPTQALLNDTSPHLINFYRWLQRGLVIEIPMLNDERHYYESRARFNALIKAGQEDSKEAAELFYYLNRTGYNGLCRFNSSGEFNVPFGKYKNINYARDFRQYQALLSKWEFQVGDFEAVPLRPDDFIYADPPYDVEFTRYSKEDFKWEDQTRLAEWLRRHAGPVVLSNQATERVLALYKESGFETVVIPGPRRISCTGDRTPALEVLAWRGIDGTPLRRFLRSIERQLPANSMGRRDTNPCALLI